MGPARPVDGNTLIHYHGGPITPETCARRVWSGRHAFISYAHPAQVELAASVCQSFALDNGAFSFWKAGKATDWDGYYNWCQEWLTHPACDFAIIPDVIAGSELENDRLVDVWPFGDRGVPVWHTNEDASRLIRLASRFPRVAIGSSAEYDVRRPNAYIARMADVWGFICDSRGRPTVKLHGLRMLNPAIFTKVPLSSADSTNVARNIGIDSAWSGSYAPATKETRADVLVERIEQYQSPAVLCAPPQTASLFDVEVA